MWLNLLRLARPSQWAKGAFVIVGPAYALADGRDVRWLAVLGALLAFGFASSSCYVVNDIRDAEADRAHPRKRLRPIASGAVPVRTGITWALALLGASIASMVLVVVAGAPAGGLWIVGTVGLYLATTTAYSMGLKHVVIIDVMCLALGFVLRVVGGCLATGVPPSSWLLNCTFFVSMFLAFGKRLGERRTMGGEAQAARGVQASYTDELLRMAVVVTGVATLLTYAQYVQARGEHYELGFNLLWLTVLPATYGLLRCIVLLERGAYDDPTELAARDRAFQLALVLFAAITIAVVGAAHRGALGGSGG